MPPRLKDIAEQLGLSVTTVSRALAGYSDVAEQTRQRVRQAAQAMGYVPDVTGQRLRQQRTNMLGFIIPTTHSRISDPFFNELLAGIGHEAECQGYDLLTSTAAPGPTEIDLYQRQVYSRRVDGMLVVRTRRQDPRIELLQKLDFPFVAFGRTEQEMDFPWVDVDGAHGLRLAVEHLASLGHRRIAYLGAPSSLTFSIHRWRGFREGMAAHGLPIVEDWIVRGDLTQGDGRRLAGALLDAPEAPQAIIAANDVMALGAMAVAQQRGLSVGRDISVIGFDDVALAEHAHPPLTTVQQPIYYIAERITAMLIKTLQGEPLAERQVLLTPKLIVRQSTGPAP